jgi:hypothetical protein
MSSSLDGAIDDDGAVVMVFVVGRMMLQHSWRTSWLFMVGEVHLYLYFILSTLVVQSFVCLAQGYVFELFRVARGKCLRTDFHVSKAVSG